jgi:hypothetical protein
MPLWLSAVGFANEPPFPNFGIPATLMSAMTHIVYAVPLALVYYFVARSD